MCGQMMPGHQISWIYILIALRAYGQYLILTKLYALVRLDHIMWCLLLSCRYWLEDEHFRTPDSHFLDK